MLKAQLQKHSDAEVSRVPLTLDMNPVDYDRLIEAVRLAGDEVNSFCCLAIHKASSAVLEEDTNSFRAREKSP
ncbi:hypothetical protein EVC37_21935 [Methylocaldum sp. BRCS4]|jgi:hypothetical protein|nr:hypothetical protein [Methylocaldum sp. BRCS4]